MVPELLDGWEPSEVSAPFWRAAREGRLVLQWCARCDRFAHPPRVYCACGSTQLDYRPVDGNGTVFAHTTVTRALLPALRDAVPYVLGLVDVAVGARMTTLIVDCAASDVRIGMPVAVAFQPVTDEVTLPVFRPRGPAVIDEEDR